jgi:uncharacterized protein YjbI with pentapeptide repeats
MTCDDSSENHHSEDRDIESLGLVLPPAAARRWRPGARAILFAGVAGACALGVGLGLWARPDSHERGIAVAQVAPDTPDAEPAGRKLQIVIGDRSAPVGAPIEVLPQAPKSLFAALTPAPRSRDGSVAAPSPAPILASAAPPAGPPPGLTHASHPDILPRLAPLMTAALAAPRLIVEKIKSVEPPTFAKPERTEPTTVRRVQMADADTQASRLAAERVAREKAAAQVAAKRAATQAAADQAAADRAEAHRTELAQAAEAKTAQMKLQKAKLAQAKLAEAKLADARLAQAKLTQAKLTQAKLTQAKLTQAKLTQAKLTQAKFAQAKLAKAAQTKQAQIRLAQAAQAQQVQTRWAQAKAEKAESIRLAKAEKAENLRLAQAEAKGRAEAQVEAKAMVFAEARDEARKRARLEALVHAVQKALPHMAAAPVETAKLDAKRIAKRAAQARHDDPMVERASLKSRKTPHFVEPAARSHPVPLVPAPPSGLVKVSAPRCASRDPGEALVCADPSLSAADRQLARAYQGARAAGVPEVQLQRQQQQWLAARSAAAREAPWAVRDVYLARIAELNGQTKDAHGDGY